MRLVCAASIVTSVICLSIATGEEWTQFRGPNGLGSSETRGLPVAWSSKENIVWKTDLPGPGTSSPIVVGSRVYVTCYTGYGIEPNEGSKDDLVRHVVCLDRASGRVLWTKDFKALQPESTYSGGNNSQHGYSSSTPASDGRRLYVFFGKSGVYCLDLDGNELWNASVGGGATGWGSSNSPVLYKDLVIINASVESGSLVALNKQSGEEVWRAKGMRSSWNTPILVNLPQGETELVVVNSGHILGFDPDNGEELWRSEAFGGYICASAIAHNDTVYALQGSTIAIRAGGRGDVSKTHELWRTSGGSNVPSPVYHDGHLFWLPGGTAYCVNAANGEIVYRQRLQPGTGTVYSSALVADGKVYCVSQRNGTFVLAAKPEFELLAHNVFEDDDSRTNASPIVDDDQLLLRTDRRLYCIGESK